VELQLHTLQRLERVRTVGAGAAPMAHTNPAVEYAPAGTGPNPSGFAAVYYVGDDGQMWNYNVTTSTGWTAYALPNAGARPAAGTSPSLVVNATQTGPNPAGFAAIYYVGDDGEIWNDNFTPGEQLDLLRDRRFRRVGVGDTPSPCETPTPAYTRIYFPGPSDEENAFTYSGSWTLSRAFSLTAPTSPSATPPTPTPVSDNPPVPTAHTHGRTRVRVRIVMDWTWSFTTTTLHRVSIRHFPSRAEISVLCRGRGCPSIARRANASREGVAQVAGGPEVPGRQPATDHDHGATRDCGADRDGDPVGPGAPRAAAEVKRGARWRG
jgi:hypothetical protein